MGRIVLAASLAALAAGCAKTKPDCAGGAVLCGGACADLRSDNLHCGACGNACAAGTACSGGACVPTCQAGLVSCSGRCVDPGTDRAFCGADAACAGGTVCGAGDVCVAGACAQSCPPGEYACAGRCVDPRSDPVYCGARRDCTGGAACGAGTCRAGVCLPAPPEGCAALPRAAGTAVKLRTVASGLDQPVHAAAPRGDASRLFVVELPGRIRLVKDGVLLAAPYLDLTGQVASGGERGLLSVAFHPSFATNGRLYVYFTGNGSGDPAAGLLGDVRIVEVAVADAAAEVAKAPALRNLVTIPHQEFANHNGGQLAFGPDGLLYAGTGDGGSGGDPLGNGQSTTSLLGKLLRIDVEQPGVPAAGNPFDSAVYHYGLRNPWRFSFDRATGDLYVGDVGQDSWEEIDFQAAAGAGQAPAPGTNWGWNVMEASHCYAATSCDATGKALPVAEYSHAAGVSVTGGFVYRGVVMPDLAATGTYFYGDFGAGFVRTLRVVNGAAVDGQDLTAALGGARTLLSSFAEDGCGELYLVELSGTVSKLVPP